MDYAFLKSVHMTCAGLSGAGFLLRATVALRDPERLRHSLLARIVPHLIDTALLVSALAMVFQWSGGFAQASWLHAKIALLLAYIGLGAVALSPKRPRRLRISAFFLACACFGLIVTSAMSKAPLGIGS